MKKLSTTLLFMLLNLRCALGATVQWKNNQYFEGKTTNQSPGFNALNLIQCSRLCSDKANCTSFFYVDGAHLNCLLLDHILDSVEGLADSSEARYYTRYNDVEKSSVSSTMSPDSLTTSRVSSTISSAFTSAPPLTSTHYWQCHDIYNKFTVDLVSGQFVFKVSSVSGNFFTASSACESDGGFLARITNLEKMYYLIDELTHCQTYPNNYIRVDGNNNDAIDYSDINQWVYSDGSQAVMSTDILSNGYLLIPGERHCLVMNLNGKVQDYNCDQTGDTYICEFEIAV